MSLPNSLNSSLLRQSWADWINSRDWQLFITFTFIDRIHPIAAERYLHTFFNKQNRRIYGRNYQKRPLCLVWIAGLEYQKRNVVHFHALVANVPADYRYQAGYMDWKSIGNNAGNIQIEKIRTLSDAIFYVTKYVTKEGDIILCPQLELSQECGPDEHGRKVIISLDL